MLIIEAALCYILRRHGQLFMKPLRILPQEVFIDWNSN